MTVEKNKTTVTLLSMKGYLGLGFPYHWLALQWVVTKGHQDRRTEK